MSHSFEVGASHSFPRNLIPKSDSQIIFLMTSIRRYQPKCPFVTVEILLILSSPANHFNGHTLLECDQAVLKELGVKKIGDRVRMFVAIKNLRTNAYGKQKRRNRVGAHILDLIQTLTSNQ